MTVLAIASCSITINCEYDGYYDVMNTKFVMDVIDLEFRTLYKVTSEFCHGLTMGFVVLLLLHGFRNGKGYIPAGWCSVLRCAETSLQRAARQLWN